MGRFIVTRSAAGERFLLQSNAGRRLAVSGDYATLDACKKGIRSLMRYLPTAPVIDVAAGEKAPNPKCEILCADGGFAYRIKAPNGKTLLASAPMQTKTAVLRAISMLKDGVADAEVLFLNPAGYTPLTLGLGDTAARSVSRKKPLSVYTPPTTPEQEVSHDHLVPEIEPEPPEDSVAAALAAVTEPAPQPPQAAPKPNGIFGRIRKVR